MTAPGRSTTMTAMITVLGVDLLAAGAALLIAGRGWQTVVAPRPRPLADDVVAVSGRTLDPAITALAVVALVGAVAVIATRGAARRLIGAIVAVVGGVLAWRAVAALDPVSTERARSLVRDARSGVALDPGLVPRVEVHTLWPGLLFGCALLVLAAGAVVVWRGQAWHGLSGRYDAPAADPASTSDAPARERADPPTETALWSALDRGDDPTAHTES